MDETTRARLLELLDDVDTAAEGDSNDAEIRAGFELAGFVRELLGTEPQVATLPTGKGSVHVDALREVLDMAEHNDVTTPEQDAALRWAVTVAERPPLSPVTVATLHLIVQAAQKGYVVRRLGNDGHVMVGTARHLVKGPDDFTFPRGDTDVRDAWLRVTYDGGVDVAWPVSDLMGEVSTGAFAMAW